MGIGKGGGCFLLALYNTKEHTMMMPCEGQPRTARRWQGMPCQIKCGPQWTEGYSPCTVCVMGLCGSLQGHAVPY